jgi:hypothetical protein
MTLNIDSVYSSQKQSLFSDLEQAENVVGELNQVLGKCHIDRELADLVEKELGKCIKGKKIDLAAFKEDGNGPDADSWNNLVIYKKECRDILKQCLSHLEGAKLREAKLDKDICYMADKLMSQLACKMGVTLDRFTLPGEEDLFDKSTKIIRIRSLDIWTLPVIGHEFGHYICPQLINNISTQLKENLSEENIEETKRKYELLKSDDIKLLIGKIIKLISEYKAEGRPNDEALEEIKREKTNHNVANLDYSIKFIDRADKVCIYIEGIKIEFNAQSTAEKTIDATYDELQRAFIKNQEARLSQEFFADALATYMLGPAFVYSFITYIFNPKDTLAIKDGPDHPSHDERIFCMLKMLQKMDEDKTSWNPHIIQDLSELWDNTLDSAKLIEKLHRERYEDRSKDIRIWYAYLKSSKPYGEYVSWPIACELYESICAKIKVGMDPNSTLVDAAALPDLLNAMWMCRINKANKRKLIDGIESTFSELMKTK